jgi:large subunit ribosomal protein L29
MLKPEEARDLSDADLRKRVTELEEERFRLKFRSATETLEQPLRLRTVRRDIARCLTILRERELAAAGTEQSPKARRRANRRSDAKGVAKRGTGARRGATKSAK